MNSFILATLITLHGGYPDFPCPDDAYSLHKKMDDMSNAVVSIEQSKSVGVVLNTYFSKCFLNNSTQMMLNSSEETVIRYLSKVSYELNNELAYKFALGMKANLNEPFIKRELLQMALVNRDFTKANELSGGQYLRFYIPEETVEDSNSSRLIMKVLDGRSIWRKVDLRDGDYLVIITTESCGFSRTFHQFFESLNLDAQNKIIQLAPQTDIFQDDKNIYDVRSVSDWPEVDYWGTPSFYFFKKGNLVDKMYGWHGAYSESIFIKKFNKYMGYLHIRNTNQPL